MGIAIGIAGTAKNTGKTTTTSAIFNELYKHKIQVALTSIGYDGEEIDNITGLPKPRLFVKKNTILATAKKCLEAGNADYDILETTDISTPLGKVCIVKVIKEGLAVVAGPNKGSQLNYIKSRMFNDLNCKVILVDGALNRLAPMIETDGIILATGASRNTDIDVLVEETKALYELLNLPTISKDDLQFLSDIKKIALVPKDSNAKTVFLKYGSLIDNEIVNEIADIIKEIDIKVIFIPALISEFALKTLNDSIGNSWANKDLIISDPIKLIIGGNPETMLKEVNRIKCNDGNIKALKNIPLLAITVNPFYPKYRFDKSSYEPGYINKENLLNKMRTSIEVPVIDIKQEGPSRLLESILSRI
ncbi:MAG: hypothetical protein GXW90_02735 [Tepidanaerobacter acetatoxydans]|uniref:lysine 5,6-aminomutase reactivase subunit KamB n=1 Tax=Tepidanaerobacter TaxID=499228 RepID=UPI000B0F3FB7|nr:MULTISPECIES: hypothetical protein [Tepidanaerobacter]NLU09855.1 hypothetical protein [Tepidanaerobacter acetatoxydans]